MNLLSKAIALLGPLPRDAARLQRIRDLRLRELLEHAWQHSAYFQHAFERAGLNPSAVSTASDLAKLPLLTRQTIREELPALADRRVDLSTCVNIRTSGTSGEALVIPSTPAEIRFAHALWFTTYMKCGVRPWHRQAKFVSATSGPRKKWGFQRLGIFRRDYCFVTAPTQEKIRWLREMKPDVVFAWGSVFNEMAAALEAAGERLEIPLAISSSEAVQRDLVTARISPQLVDIYGAIEGAAYSIPCPRGRGHHIDTRWNVIELLDENNQPAQSGRIVLTCLWRRTLPLIRYEMGDLGTWAVEPCGCGNPMPLLASLDGRASDLLELPGGEKVTASAMVVVMRGVPGIRQYQIVQPAAAEVLCHVVATKDFPDDGEARIRQSIERVFRGKLRVTLHLTNAIPQIAGQKVRSIITQQHLSRMRSQGLDVNAFLQRPS